LLTPNLTPKLYFSLQQQLVHLRDGLVFGHIQGVGVDLYGGVDVAMAQDFHRGASLHALQRKKRRAAMAQIVKAHRRLPCTLQQTLKAAPNVGRYIGVPTARGKTNLFLATACQPANKRQLAARVAL
jgi:hypothetical protein